MTSSPSPRPGGSSRLILSAVFIAGLGGGWLGSNLTRPHDGSSPSSTTAASPSGNSSRRGSAGDRGNGSSSDNNNSSDTRPLPAADSREFAESVRAVFRETDESRRVAAFDKLLARSDSAHLAAFVDLIHENDLNGNDSGSEWSHLWALWGSTDAHAALQYVSSKDWKGWDPLAPSEAGRRTIAAWVEKDPASALSYYEQGDMQKGDRNLVYPLVRGLCNTDPDAAMQWLLKTGLGRGDEYKAVIDSQRRSKGMEGTDAWFDQLATAAGTPERDIAGLAEKILASRQLLDPGKALEWVEARKDAPWIASSNVVESTASAYARNDPQGAIEWTEKLGNPAAAQSAWMQWMQTKPLDGTAWLDQHSDTQYYDVFAPTAAQFLAYSDPDKARKLASNLTDEATRTRIFGYIDRAQESRRAQQEQVRQAQPR